MRIRSIGIMTILNGIGAVVGILQSVAIAYFFGASRVVEMFFAAVAVEASILHMTQTGQLTAIFLPVYHRIKQQQGVGSAYAAFAVMINIMVTVVVCLGAGMYFLAPLLVRLRVPGFGADDLQVTVVVFQSLLPLLAIHVAKAMLTTLANAEKWFGAPELVSVAARVVGVITIVSLASSWGIWALVVGMYINNALAVVALAALVMRLGYRHHLRFRQAGFQTWPLLKQLTTTFLYVIATQCYFFAIDAGLSQMPQGVFAVFKYVQQLLVGKTSTILLRPVNVVFYTHFAEAIAQGSARATALTQRALGLSLALCVLTVVGFVAGGVPLLQGLWGSEKFSHKEIQLAAQLATWMYLLFVVTATGQIYRRMAMSLGMVRSYYVLSSIVQFGCALIAVGLLPQSNVYGAFTVIAVNMVGLALLPICLVAVARKDLLVFHPPADVVRWLLAAGIGLGLVLLLTRFRVFEEFGQSRHALLGHAGIAASIALVVTLCVAWLAGVSEVRSGMHRVKSLVQNPATLLR